VARGAMVHLDYVGDMLGDAAARVDFAGFLDSPLWIDMPPFLPNKPSFAREVQLVHDFANISHVDEACAAAQVASPWKCLMGEYRMPYVLAPYIIVASQYDEFQLHNDVGWPNSTDKLAYVKSFANRTRTLMTTLSSPHHAVFSQACWSHDLSPRKGFFRESAEGVSMSSAVLQFVKHFAERGEALAWMDSCTGFDCGRGCAKKTPTTTSSTTTMATTMRVTTPLLEKPYGHPCSNDTECRSHLCSQACSADNPDCNCPSKVPAKGGRGAKVCCSESASWSVIYA